ncbi:hypothetical protein [Lyngbya confervoides]|uniref:DUF4349 domain-containing protein n=1 Tax=Lyngbya confervoides BDU141951 TaxID=1574623 RepID=A0ABD4T7Q1_9CYAN|nr:hypothetical protein [Lyngbya confervoides]MCM1984525.1 hypothetical protein [Lyngbya confervoides BDU141951]
MTSHSRYSSQLFQFVQCQSHRLRDRTGHLLRQGKNQLTWGAQLCFLALRSLFQAGRQAALSFGQALHSGAGFLGAAVQSGERPLAGLDSDIPVLRVMEAISLTPPQGAPPFQRQVTLDFPQSQSRLQAGITAFKAIARRLRRGRPFKLPVKGMISAQPSNLRVETQPLLQGIASLLSTRTLVLVTADQHLLDILSPDQQSRLYRRILWEVASLYRRRRQAQRFARPLRILTTLPKAVARLGSAIRDHAQSLPLPIPPLRPLLEVHSAKTPFRLPPLPDGFGMVPGKIGEAAPLSLPQASRSGDRRGLKTGFKIGLKTGFKIGLKTLFGAMAALPALTLPAIAAPTSPPAPAAQQPSFPSEWADPGRMKAKPNWNDIQGMMPRGFAGRQGLVTQPVQHRPSAPVSQAIPSGQTTHAKIRYSVHGPEIDVEAEFMGYDPHLLERILQGLDTWVLHLETTVGLLWSLVGALSLGLVSFYQRLRPKFIP